MKKWVYTVGYFNVCNLYLFWIIQKSVGENPKTTEFAARKLPLQANVSCNMSTPAVLRLSMCGLYLSQ